MPNRLLRVPFISPAALSPTPRWRTLHGPGARVVVVAEGSVAAQAGLQPDDVIVALDQQPVTDVGQLLSILVKEHARALITVVRNGHRLFVAADVQTQ
ncbi:MULTISPECIES: PDZ domain-containing protein [Rhizobium]|uniref:PDZ domain-containing protein n=1 Tax=Rhizobium TaxID=379 RepID=UPI001FDF34A7|nr:MULTISPECIES: PDZ domain-containing protein [Rhizobium]